MDKIIIKLDEYILRNVHPVTIIVYGAGGTGSHLVWHLARVNAALLMMGLKGIDLSVVDFDSVGATTPVRAMLNYSGIGFSKALSLVSGINASFGIKWKAYPRYIRSADFIILCTDTVRSRRMILDEYVKTSNYKYYIDCGNTSDSGQIILGTSKNEYLNMKKSSKSFWYVPDFFDMFPDVQDEDVRESCSVFESVQRQGIFVNSIIANLAGQMIYELLAEHAIDHHGYFMNMENGWSKIPVELRKLEKKKK
jgi:PRTRC genetic system ThiF family protein